MATMKVLAAFALLLTPSLAAISWSSSEDSTRRLAVTTVMSSTKADAGCIVGGYDPAHPARVYVGGPCSAIGNKSTPTTDFRYVMMETIDFALEDSAGKESAAMTSYGTDINQVQDLASHTEVGVLKKVHFTPSKINHAGIFASVNSYLSKKNFDFNINSFVVDGKDAVTKKYKKLDICVKQCCDVPGVTGCTCKDKKCPTTKIAVKTGDYKYSIFAASYDEAGDVGTNAATKAYTAGAAGNGWSRVVKEYGTGTTKKLAGNFAVFQGIDFTTMKADTLTITGGGAATTYKTMTECDVEGTAACTLYSVASMTVASTGWSGSYSFPQTYNIGSWSTTDSKAYTMVPDSTKTVKIHCVRAAAKNLVKFGLAKDAAAAAKMKVVLLKYTFDISGVDATTKSGNYFVYDPTVTTSAGAAAGGTVSAGRVATMPSMIMAALAAVVMSFKM